MHLFKKKKMYYISNFLFCIEEVIYHLLRIYMININFLLTKNTYPLNVSLIFRNQENPKFIDFYICSYKDLSLKFEVYRFLILLGQRALGSPTYTSMRKNINSTGVKVNTKKRA